MCWEKQLTDFMENWGPMILLVLIWLPMIWLHHRRNDRYLKTASAINDKQLAGIERQTAILEQILVKLERFP